MKATAPIRRTICLTLIACLSATALTLVASADERTVRDDLRRDAGGPLDLKEVSHGHRGQRLVHTLRTYDAWRDRWLRGDQDSINLTFNRQDSGSAGVERVLAVDYENGALVASMFNVLTDPPTRVGKVRIRRPNNRVLRLIFPQRLLKRNHLQAYRWKVNVLYEGPGCDYYCADHIPEAGRRGILHDLHVQ